MLLDVPSSFHRPDGRWEHHFRQSDVSRVRQCPDLHRRELYAKPARAQSDAQLVGTAVHEGIALAAGLLMDDRQPSLSYCLDVVHACIEDAWPECRKLSYAGLTHALTASATGLHAFWNGLLPQLEQTTVLAVERQFDILVYEDSSRLVYISGTYDLGLPDVTIDHKTSNGKSWTRDEWKVQRYNAQSTIYSWARDMETCEQGRPTLSFAQEDKLLPFTFHVMNLKTQGTEFVTVQRTVGDCAMMLEELLGIAAMVEARLDRWPLRPDDWHCSPVWCDAWSECRGRHLGPDPWGLLAKRALMTGTAVELEADPFAGLPSF